MAKWFTYLLIAGFISSGFAQPKSAIEFYDTTENEATSQIGWTGDKAAGKFFISTPGAAAPLTSQKGNLTVPDTVTAKAFVGDGSKLTNLPTSATGTVGPQGPIGLTGAIGPQGPKGDTGVAGLTGPAGPQGPIGLTGPQGPIGLTGAVGLQGPKGDTGVAGPQGPIGLTGATGLKGDIGATGPKGDIGATGLKGDIGATGAAGPNYLIAFGTIYTDGSIKSGSGNFTCLYNATNLQYEITISGVNYHISNYATVSTLIGSPGFIGTNSISGKLVIETYNTAGSAVPRNFNFAVFYK